MTSLGRIVVVFIISLSSVVGSTVFEDGVEFIADNGESFVDAAEEFSSGMRNLLGLDACQEIVDKLNTLPTPQSLASACTGVLQIPTADGIASLVEHRMCQSLSGTARRRRRLYDFDLGGIDLLDLDLGTIDVGNLDLDALNALVDQLNGVPASAPAAQPASGGGDACAFRTVMATAITQAVPSVTQIATQVAGDVPNLNDITTRVAGALPNLNQIGTKVIESVPSLSQIATAVAGAVPNINDIGTKLLEIVPNTNDIAGAVPNLNEIGDKIVEKVPNTNQIAVSVAAAVPNAQQITAAVPLQAIGEEVVRQVQEPVREVVAGVLSAVTQVVSDQLLAELPDELRELIQAVLSGQFFLVGTAVVADHPLLCVFDAILPVADRVLVPIPDFLIDFIERRLPTGHLQFLCDSVSDITDMKDLFHSISGNQRRRRRMAADDSPACTPGSEMCDATAQKAFFPWSEDTETRLQNYHQKRWAMRMVIWVLAEVSAWVDAVIKIVEAPKGEVAGNSAASVAATLQIALQMPLHVTLRVMRFVHKFAAKYRLEQIRAHQTALESDRARVIGNQQWILAQMTQFRTETNATMTEFESLMVHTLDAFRTEINATNVDTTVANFESLMVQMLGTFRTEINATDVDTQLDQFQAVMIETLAAFRAEMNQKMKNNTELLMYNQQTMYEQSPGYQAPGTGNRNNQSPPLQTTAANSGIGGVVADLFGRYAFAAAFGLGVLAVLVSQLMAVLMVLVYLKFNRNAVAAGDRKYRVVEFYGGIDTDNTKTDTNTELDA